MKNGSEKYIEAVKYLGELYDFVNRRFFADELEKPVITVCPDGKNKAYGWFVCGEIWREDGEETGATELNVSAQFLNRPFADIAETMLHEMVHQYAYRNQMQDCSRGGSYHNKLYAKLAREHGLEVEKADKTGWSETRLTVISREIIDEFATEHKFIYRLPEKKGTKVRSSSTRKYICPICGMSVRATKQVRIMCADCDALMCEEE